MKFEFLLLASMLTLGIIAAFVSAQIVQTGEPATISIGTPSSSTTTTSPAPINNPANISFQINAKDSSGQGQDINVSFYDHANHHFLNSSEFVGYGTVSSPTSLADFELTYDNQNLDVMVNGLNLTTVGNTTASIAIEDSSPQIKNFALYRAYHIELPWDSTLFSSITLTIKLGDLPNINYTNLVVYRCGVYSIFSNVCSDSGGWQPQTISIDQTNHLVTLTINHFSVYAVGSSSSVQSTTSSSTSASTTTSASSSQTTTTSYIAPVQGSSGSSGNSGSSSGSGYSGGGGGALPLSTTTTTPSTTSTTVLIIRQNSTSSSSSSATTEAAPISGLLGLSSTLSPFFVAAVVIVASIAAIAVINNRYDLSGVNFSRLKFWEKSYKTFPSYKKPRKAKKNTELKLSL